MSKVINYKLENNTLLVDCLAENSEYLDFKDRIIDQILKNVSIKGYRKGNAPKAKALEKVSPIELQSTVIQESIQKFFPTLQTEIDEELKKQERSPVSTVISVSPEFTKETDKGFEFRVVINLLPKVDLTKISKIKINLPDGESIEGRVSKKEFFAREEKNLISYFNQYTETESKSEDGFKLKIDLKETLLDINDTKTQEGIDIFLGVKQFPEDFEKNLIGLKKDDTKNFKIKINEKEIEYEIKVIKVEKPKHKNTKEVIENSQEARDQIVSIEEFKQKLEKIYNSETEDIHTRIKKENIIKEVLKSVPDFEMEDENINNEIKRIFEVLQEQSVSLKTDIADTFKTAGLPLTGKKVETQEDVKFEIEDYVKKEFKLMNILQVIYFEKVEDKVKESDIQNLAKEIKKDPKKFQLQQQEVDITQDKLESIAYDRLLRSKAYNWLQSEVKTTIEKA